MSLGKSPQRLLLVDPDASFAAFCREALQRQNLFQNFEIIHVGTMTQARQQIGVAELDGVLIYANLPDGDGMELLKDIKALPMDERPASVFISESDASSLAVQAFKAGAQDYLSKILMSGQALRSAVQGALERHNIQRETAKQNALYAHMALHDPLTNLANRSLFQDRLGHGIDRAKRNNGKLAVLMIDLDGFKKVNDTYGHDAGDAVLVEMGKRLQQCLRTTDTLARLGGDEFAILLEGIVDGPDAYHVIRRVLATDDAPVNYNGAKLEISMSVGFSVFPETTQTAEALVQVADQAMYQAKRSHAGCAYPKGFVAPAKEFGVSAISAYIQ